jgi:8-oxo-dGTP pyrophosphatase MutT (NUDIX family)
MADRPGPGEELHEGAPVAPRQAATVILLRGGADGLEVLLVKRNPAQRFMGGAWVFPGGAVDAREGEGDAAHRLAGVREVAEEAGVALPDPAALVKLSRWITPEAVTIRFDTHFFLARAPEDADPRPDGSETVDLRWFTPAAALEAGERDEITLVFPTIKTLEELARFATADALLAWAASRPEIPPVTPRVRMDEGERPRLLLPGEAGYED